MYEWLKQDDVRGSFYFGEIYKLSFYVIVKGLTSNLLQVL